MDSYSTPLIDRVYEIKLLDASDDDMLAISQQRSLGLNLPEMKKLRDYFAGEGRNPTDVEMEAFCQAWSEHCCYKTSRPVLERTVFNVKIPGVCICSDDAGVVEFDDEHAYVVALESHNHPSALDPYGGAATGIGGILRDVLCMGGQPIALVDPIFFGPPDYPEEKLPPGVKHPQYLFKGVVSGIADYGNRVGIPTVSGMVEFDDSYVGNCLVNVGCIGMVRKDRIARSRAGNVGDIYIMAGGKTGRDGIHGVSFASAELGEESQEEIPAVQLGYAIMKEPLIHATLELNEKGLLTGMKDFGGGGLSCVAGEMALAGGHGAVVYLDKIPLKEGNMAPWEIWVSESQERMMYSVLPENVEKVLEILDFWDVPAEVVGEVNDSKRIKVIYKETTVLDLDLEFLNEGVRYERPYVVVEKDESVTDHGIPDMKEAVSRVMGSMRVGSRESVIRRYDHEVRGSTVIKPLQGVINKQTHGDASVIKPLKDSSRGLAITCAVNPGFCRINPYWGAVNAVDEIVRNLVSVNARPHSLADCLNFGNPEKQDRMGELVRACDGLRYAAEVFSTPYVSGNVSLYNEAASGPIAPTPTLMGVGIVGDVRKAVTSDFKREGNSIYLVGETKNELGGSEYYRVMGFTGGVVPRTDPKETLANMERILQAMDKCLVKSCHDISDGGLIACVMEMCFGGDLGAELNLAAVEDLAVDIKLFSESGGRWLMEVSPGDLAAFEEIMPSARRIGMVTQEKEVAIPEAGVRLSLDELRQTWLNAMEGK